MTEYDVDDDAAIASAIWKSEVDAQQTDIRRFYELSLHNNNLQNAEVENDDFLLELTSDSEEELPVVKMM